MKKKFLKVFAVISALAFMTQPFLFAQEVKTLNLEQAVDLALQNNHLLNIKKYQAEEKEQKVNEDKVKYLPMIIVGGSYQYNSNLPGLTITQGSFGQLPLGSIIIPLPAMDQLIEAGEHNNYNAGITFYQPVSQIAKISTGVQVSKTELKIAQEERNKAGFQIKQAVEKLYFGLLMLQKQIEEAEIKSTLAKTKLYDIENAMVAGKTTESTKYGLSANAGDEEQNLLKLKMQYDDYTDDLRHLIGLDPSAILKLDPVNTENLMINAPTDTSLTGIGSNNNELRIASLNNEKAGYAIKAGKFSYLPDLGILGGYTWQDGNALYPKNNTFIGASLKWNIQDVFSNRTIQNQRTFMKKQAEESLANTKEEVNKDIAKACRKLKQSDELIKVARKVVEFRREDLKIQTDRHNSGINLEADLLTAKASLAKAESDYFAAQLNYRIALSELQILTGTY